MTTTQSVSGPLARLVLFLVCLAIVGSCIAGAHYAAVDLPAQKAVQVPLNMNTGVDFVPSNDVNNYYIVTFLKGV